MYLVYIMVFSLVFGFCIYTYTQKHSKIYISSRFTNLQIINIVTTNINTYMYVCIHYEMKFKAYKYIHTNEHTYMY